MRGTVKHLALATLVAFTTSAQTVGAQARPDLRGNLESPFLTTSPILQSSLDRIFRGSALWRQAAEEVRKTGRYALVVTPADPVVVKINNADRGAFDPMVLAEAVPLLRDGSKVPVVLVYVNLPRLTAIHDARLSAPLHVEADLDRLLIHELYGHGVPYLLAGDLSGRCADPKPGERPLDACSIRRENSVRRELGLGRRGDAGLSSLALAGGQMPVRE